MPTNLPVRDPFRRIPAHETRQDRLAVAMILLACGLLTLGMVAMRTPDAPFVTATLAF